MRGLTSLDASSSIFNLTNKIIQFELSKAIEKSGKRYSLRESKIFDENFQPEDIRDEIL